MASLGQNDPCHCGSGREYTKCCLDHDSGFAFQVEGAKKEWEKRVILELYDEYAYILRERRLGLKACAIALTDSDSFWAQWNPTTRVILFSRKLIENHSWFRVLSILRHEMTHQLVDESCVPGSVKYKPHGEQFRIACGILGVPEEYRGATACLQSANLDWRSERRDDIIEKLLEKVRKLLSLATSSNEHEALLAMNKVRELYAKYNLDEAEGSRKQRFAHLVITHGKKRVEAHQSRITSILVEHFFVQVLTTKIFDAKSLERHAGIEIIGARENVMMAEYVYHFLIQQTDYLVSEIAKTKPLSRIQRKSYKLGILAGFSEKLREPERARNVKDSVSPDDTESGLIKLALARFHKDPALDQYLNNVYPRISSGRGGSQYVDGLAFSQGQSIGRTITLNKAVSGSDESRGHLLNE